MSEKLRKLKEEASRLIAKGRVAEAAQQYLEIVRADPRDLTARQKLAELYARMGRTSEAVAEYQSVVGSYAADGQLLKAIAVCKIILQTDPTHTETQGVLASLSTKRRGEPSTIAIPKAMSSALPPGKRSAKDIRGAPASQVKARPDESRMDLLAARPPSGSGELMGTLLPLPAPDGAVVVPLEAPRRTDVAIASGRDVSTGGQEVSAASARALMEAFDAAPGPSTSPSFATSNAIAIDVGLDANASSTNAIFDSAPDAPVVVGVSVPRELPELPGDERASLEEPSDDGGEVLDLTEPTHIEVDQIPPIPLFSDLPRDAFISLTERMDLRVAARGERLVQEGEAGSSMFIIIQGRVIVTRTVLDGAQPTESGEVTLAELTEGAFFGEMALLSEAPRMASVVCSEDTMLFEIKRDLLANITREYPSVGEVMKRFHKNRLLTNLLKTSPIFQPFSTRDKRDLIEKFKSRAIEEGLYLITRERPGDGLYVLLSGRCEVYDQNAEGNDMLLAELKEGDVFGEMSMLWHKRTCASVKASTPCVVLRLPRESFNEVIMTHPQILETLTAMSERRERHNQERHAPEIVSDYLV